MAAVDTTDGNNWTVLVFRCSRRTWTETLSNLFSGLDKQQLSLMPHYTIRSFEPSTDSMIISFRILREQESEGAIMSLIEKTMKGSAFEIDPTAGSHFSHFHTWIRHGEKSEKWTKERCRILSQMSRFALEIINSKTTLDDRLEWAHLFSNMIAVFDYEKSFRSPETYTDIRLLRYHQS